MEEQHECLFRSIYTEPFFSAEDAERIAEGQFPIILAKDGIFTKLYVSDSELDNYGIFDANDEDKAAQKEINGPHVPIVWVRAEDGSGMHPTGIEPKVQSEPNE
jgi:hypothetical protein